ncbi:MAG: HEAT repeat domain-containing protein [Sedimentisphaerales bacterium]|nr:HEAT repeat domain-containing protein [Sedimentisphaerales bacterium]
MSINHFKKVSLAAGIAGTSANANQNDAVNKLLAGIKDADEKVRTEAWLSAGEVGAPAVIPLAETMTDDDLEIARAAKRALWKIVRHAGRPGAAKEKTAVVAQLVVLLGNNHPTSVRREVIWMLSEIGGRNAITPIARLTTNPELREDARMALERIPTKRALQALKFRFKNAPEDFKPNMAQSLRKRGVEVDGYPCQKLVPQKETNLKSL